MTTTMTAEERAEISRRNGRKSCGPCTHDGKERSKFNALKHGLDAKTPVLPGEDPEAYRRRIAAWTADFRPRNQAEFFLVEQAARVSWQIERADRAEAARLTEAIQNAAAEQARRVDAEVAELGRRLLRDQFGPLAPGPGGDDRPAQTPVAAATGPADDADHPSRLISRLESSGAGCRWLLDRWAELRALLDQARAWQVPDRLAAIRL